VKERPITGIDRMLDWSDRADVSIGTPQVRRRRTYYRCGKLHVIVVEGATGTLVYLEEAENVGPSGSGVIIETRAEDLLKAAEAVREVLASPPAVKRRPR
jgi:hypothetical protein